MHAVRVVCAARGNEHSRFALHATQRHAQRIAPGSAIAIRLELRGAAGGRDVPHLLDLLPLLEAEVLHRVEPRDEVVDVAHALVLGRPECPAAARRQARDLAPGGKVIPAPPCTFP